MNIAWIILLTLASVSGGTALNLWLLHKTHDVSSMVWLLEHVICPVIRILVLLLVVSLIYPALNDTSSFEFWRMLVQREHFSDLVNILFLVGLALAFAPVVSHPVFAMPVQSILTIAVVFSWQFGNLAESLILMPTLILWLKIIGYMLVAYFITREASIPLSRWLDHRYAIDGSIRLVSDALYLVLQIPVMLIYCSYLRQQITA